MPDGVCEHVCTGPGVCRHKKQEANKPSLTLFCWARFLPSLMHRGLKEGSLSICLGPGTAPGPPGDSSDWRSLELPSRIGDRKHTRSVVIGHLHARAEGSKNCRKQVKGR